MNQRPPPGTPVFDPKLGFEVVTTPSEWCTLERPDGTLDHSVQCVYRKEGADCSLRDCNGRVHASRELDPIIYLKKETYLALKILGTL